MKFRRFWCLAASCGALAVPEAVAQGSPGARPLRGLRVPVTNTGGTVPAAAPGYTYALFDYPAGFNTNGFGINRGAASSEVNVVGGLGKGTGYPIGFSDRFLRGVPDAVGGNQERHCRNLPSHQIPRRVAAGRIRDK
jgi:hypothetical protein